MSTKIAPGDAVLTKFGAGVVIRCFSSSSPSSSPSSSSSCSRANDGKLLNDGTDINEQHSLSSSEAAASSSAGETSRQRVYKWATVRLWRLPGKSIASCAMAHLLLAADDENDEDDSCGGGSSSSCLLLQKKLVAAPGMIVRASKSQTKDSFAILNGHRDEHDVTLQQQDEDDQQLYLIEQYLPATDVYIASPIHDNDNTGTTQCQKGNAIEKEYISLSPHQIIQASSKFYPILQDLVDRGESAWNMAVERSNLQLVRQPPNALVENLSNNLSSVVTFNTSSDFNDDDEEETDGNAKCTGNNEKLAKSESESSTSLIQTLESTLDTSSNESYAILSNSTTLLGKGTLLPPLPNMSATTDEIKQIYEMLRDEDLAQLFQKGQARLKELVEVDVPEETRRILMGVGIEFDDDDDEDEELVEEGAGKTATASSSVRRKMDKLRKEALTTLTELLKTKIIATDENGNFVIHANNSINIQVNANTILGDDDLLASYPVTAMMEQTQERFTQMFDQLSKAATSDPQLLQIFGSISEKTRVWQEMSGRLLQTRTASLFMEGGQRLRARAAEMLTVGGGNVREAFAARGNDGITANNAALTRAFTEGDIAKAKLKSMEMGDAIRQRLFKAIELRSESSGGLDAIIAGSLTKLHNTAHGYSTKVTSLLGLEGLSSEDNIQSVIASLQQSASSTMKGTKETLIALLSQRSGYRDLVLLRLERTFIDLESQLGKDLSAEQIAEISKGEGGSMALFQPIAMKATKEIEVQLDAAEEKMRESKHWNTNADDAMIKVRQITRGELSMNDIIDMAAGYLDDEQVVANSGGLIVKAEGLLDSFEAASARLSGDSARSKMPRGADATTGLMDIAIKAGITKDAVMQGVDGLDMNKLLDHTQSAITDEAARRELISSAGDSALDFLLKILPSMPVPPFDGVRDGLVYHLSNLSMAGFKVKKEDIKIEIAGIRASSAQTTNTRAVKASELLVIDIRNISATLDDAVWSFEQTYMPYLKGSGKANTRLWDGAIRLKFELRRRIAKMEIDPATGRKVPTWKPVLCLNDRSCSIGGVDLTVQGEGRIAWVANKLASLLGTRLRDYVVNVIINALTNNIGRLIEMLNSNLCNYWDLIMRTADLELDKLPELAAHHITTVEVDETEDEVELVWRERVPLGLNILTNDKSGWLKVIDLPRGTQARMVAQSKQLDPELFNGSTIISVNGRRYGPETRVELFAALKDPARPKAILFKLAPQNDLVQMKKMFKNSESVSRVESLKRSQEVISDLVTTVVIIDEGDIGLKLRNHDNFALSVVRFTQDANGGINPVEKSGKVLVGDLLSHINGTLVLGENGEGKRKAFALLEEVGSKRPLSLSFVKPYKHHISLKKCENECMSFGGPSEFIFTEVNSSTNSNEKKMVLSDFALSEGAAETGGVFVGDNLVFINGIPVGAGCRFLKNSDPSPSLGELMA